MYKFIYTLTAILIYTLTSAQELNCEVVVNADKVVSGNPQLFKSLETAISEFINQTRWTDKDFQPGERIVCSMIININSQEGTDHFKAGIQVQASRPVFNSIYTTPIFNHNDPYFSFDYTEGEPLIYNPNVYQSELVSVLSFYAYLILGMDADTFADNGGDPYYQQCMTIIDQVENKDSNPGWKPNSNQTNRWVLIHTLTDQSNSVFRKTLYNYHRLGLDIMSDNIKKAKEQIKTALVDLKVISMNYNSQVLYRMFMDAKADEIADIFSDGPATQTVELRNVLNAISPVNAQKWNKIK